MESSMSNGMLAHTESFSIATQIYVRLRRVSGRVIDAMYLAENTEYARYVTDLALATGDPELAQQVTRLGVVMGLNSQPTAKTEVKNSQLTEAEVVKSFSMF